VLSKNSNLNFFNLLDEHPNLMKSGLLLSFRIAFTTKKKIKPVHTRLQVQSEETRRPVPSTQVQYGHHLLNSTILYNSSGISETLPRYVFTGYILIFSMAIRI